MVLVIIGNGHFSTRARARFVDKSWLTWTDRLFLSSSFFLMSLQWYCFSSSCRLDDPGSTRRPCHRLWPTCYYQPCWTWCPSPRWNGRGPVCNIAARFQPREFQGLRRRNLRRCSAIKFSKPRRLATTSGFFLAIRKKTQGKKNSKLKEKTKTQAHNSNFWHSLKK